MEKNTLSNFANILLKEANDQRNLVLTDLEAQRESALKKVDESLKERLEQAVNSGMSRLEYQKRQALTQREAVLSHSLLQNRKHMFEEIFADVEAQIREFTKSEHYKTFLLQEFRQAEAYFPENNGETICTVMPSDMELIQGLFRLPGLKFVSSNRDFIGGFILENPILRRYADCTLHTRMNEQKEMFRQTDALRIE